MSNEMERVNTRLSKEQVEFIEQEAERKGMSKSFLIMLAVEKYMQDTKEQRFKMEFLKKGDE